MGLVIYGISLDHDFKDLYRYIKRKRSPWPQYYDGKGWENPIVSHFQIHGIPQLIVNDKQGIVKYTDIDARRLEEALLPLLEQPVTAGE